MISVKEVMLKIANDKELKEQFITAVQIRARHRTCLHHPGKENA